MADNLNKRPSKGILKNSSSFDRPEGGGKKPNCPDSKKGKSKETKWDEMNIIATLHPADKDYGHMKVDEPKTPYNYETNSETDELDASDLATKLKAKEHEPPKFQTLASDDEDESDDDADLTPEEKARRKDFIAKRKKHYNEYYAVKLAKKQMAAELSSESEEDPTTSGPVSPSSQPNSSNRSKSRSKSP